LTYVIGEPCIDVMDRACAEECPVACGYEGARSLCIHLDECVDYGACKPVCPVEAIYYEDDLLALVHLSRPRSARGGADERLAGSTRQP
jgi:NAD-dependent dihydropyrimidine dehydrogenase PreA subunit